jgi:hypothetical protein
MEKSKDERTSNEIKRLKKLLANIPKDRINSVNSLIVNAAFMTITLEDLIEVINEKGVISEYQNGENQWGTKKSPEIEVYNSMIKNHMGIIKQLSDFIPDDQPKVNTDELMGFLKRVK